MQALASDTRARSLFTRVARTTLRRNKLRFPKRRANQKSSGYGAGADPGQISSAKQPLCTPLRVSGTASRFLDSYQFFG